MQIHTCQSSTLKKSHCFVFFYIYRILIYYILEMFMLNTKKARALSYLYSILKDWISPPKELNVKIFKIRSSQFLICSLTSTYKKVYSKGSVEPITIQFLCVGGKKSTMATTKLPSILQYSYVML